MLSSPKEGEMMREIMTQFLNLFTTKKKLKAKINKLRSLKESGTITDKHEMKEIK